MNTLDKENKEKLVKELYEKYPYPSRSNPKSEEIKYFAQWVAQTFGENSSYWKGKEVLELGCGTGELANALALCGAKVVAVDFSKNSLKHARALSRKLKTTGKLKFLEKNILHLNDNDFDGKKFDAVVALGSLHHTVDALGGFRIACKYAKQEGLVIIGLYNKYARLRHRIKRAFISTLAGKNIEKRIEIGKKYFGTNPGANKAWAADKYGQVHESYHSVGEVLHWFKEEGIEFISSKPKFEREVIDEIFWLLNKKGAFFVMTGKKQ